MNDRSQMKVTPLVDLWKCGYCGVHKVVPELARACERRHEGSDDADD